MRTAHLVLCASFSVSAAFKCSVGPAFFGSGRKTCQSRARSIFLQSIADLQSKPYDQLTPTERQMLLTGGAPPPGAPEVWAIGGAVASNRAPPLATRFRVSAVIGA